MFDTLNAKSAIMATLEAEQALLRGKLPRKVGLRFTFEQNEWVAMLDAALQARAARNFLTDRYDTAKELVLGVGALVE